MIGGPTVMVAQAAASHIQAGSSRKTPARCWTQTTSSAPRFVRCPTATVVRTTDATVLDATSQTVWNGGGLIKVLWHDGQGLCLFAKRLERGRFIWPSPADGVVTITPAQLGYLLEGIDWRMPQHTWRPQAAG